MMDRYKRHTPFHLYLDNAIYFVTVKTLNGIRFFESEKEKGILKEQLKKCCDRYDVKLYAWVILSNHYHILFQFKKNQTLARLIGAINGGSSYYLNRKDNKKGRHIWWNYWDNCIRDEKTFYLRFNYIHHNPVKHRYAGNMEEYQFSSYWYYLKRYGYEYTKDIWERYPVIDFIDEQDDL